MCISIHTGMALFKKKSVQEEVTSLTDIQAILEFLDEAKQDIRQLQKTLKQLEELEKERQVADSGVLQINLSSQIKQFDKLLEEYEYFQNDTDINGIRVKHLAKKLLKYAEQAGMKDVVKKKQQESKWKMMW
jgi:hypothetical protein